MAPIVKCNEQASLKSTTNNAKAISQNNTILYLRDAESFSGTKIKMVANVSMVTECVLLCEKDENCDFSVLDAQNCTLYSMMTSDHNITDQTEGNPKNQTADSKVEQQNERPPCKRVSLNCIHLSDFNPRNTETFFSVYLLQGKEIARLIL